MGPRQEAPSGFGAGVCCPAARICFPAPTSSSQRRVGLRHARFGSHPSWRSLPRQGTAPITGGNTTAPRRPAGVGALIRISGVPRLCVGWLACLLAAVRIRLSTGQRPVRHSSRCRVQTTATSIISWPAHPCLPVCAPPPTGRVTMLKSRRPCSKVAVVHCPPNCPVGARREPPLSISQDPGGARGAGS